MSNLGFVKDWSSIRHEVNAEVDRFYDPLVLQFLKDNYPEKKKKSSANYPVFDVEGSAFIYYNKGKGGDCCMVQDTASGTGYGPAYFMRKFGPYSGMSSKDASVTMRLETYGEDRFKELFGYIPGKLKKVKTPRKPTIKTLKDIETQNTTWTQEGVDKARDVYKKAKKGTSRQFTVDRGISEETCKNSIFANLKHTTYDFKVKSDGVEKHIKQDFIVAPEFDRKGNVTNIKKYFSNDSVAYMQKEQEIEKSLSGKKSKGVSKKLNIKNALRLMWKSDNFFDASTIVVTEDLIDCMSHKDIFKDTNYAYMAVGGRESDIIKRYFQYMIAGANSNKDKPVNIVFSFDNDKAGLKYDKVFSDLLPENYKKASIANNKDAKFLFVKPPEGASDWNDYLQIHNKRVEDALSNDYALAQEGPSESQLSI